jgi:hypothetical protein
MDHFNAHRLSLTFLATVLMSAGLVAPVGGADEDGGTLRRIRVLPQERPFQCIVAAEFSIGGMRLGGDLTMLAALGAPESLSRGHGEDDGGDYVATTYHYAGLDVTMVRGKIDVVEATSSHWSTPGGLRPGMDRAEALALLGREPEAEYLDDGAYSFAGCPEWHEGELVWNNADNYFDFGFGADGRLSFVRLVAERP